MTIYHMHHIVPKHMGGSNNPSNLVQLTIEEHAEEHRKLYELYGLWQDKLAWKALSGQINMCEASKEAMRMAGAQYKNMSYEERHGNRALEIRKMRSESNRNRKGIKYTKDNKHTGSDNLIRVCCLKCKKVTSPQGLGHHKKKCFNNSSF